MNSRSCSGFALGDWELRLTGRRQSKNCAWGLYHVYPPVSFK